MIKINKIITIELDEKSVKELLPKLPQSAQMIKANYLPISKKIVIEFFIGSE